MAKNNMYKPEIYEEETNLLYFSIATLLKYSNIAIQKVRK